MSDDLTGLEIDRLLSWGREHTGALQRHVSWLKDLGGQALPGAGMAIAEIEKDVERDLALMSKLLDSRGPPRVRDRRGGAGETR